MGGMEALIGCDYHDGRRYCERNDVLYLDEVEELRYCVEHAGPLAWSAHDVDAYSLALKLAGMHDAPLPLPSKMGCQHSSSAGDAPLPRIRSAA